MHHSKINQNALALQPALSLSGEWHVVDLRAEYSESAYELPCCNEQNLIHLLQQDGCIEKQRRTRDVGEHNTRAVWIWTWDQQAKEKLQARANEMNTLPCGCRSHIPDMRESPDGYGECKVCGEEHQKRIFEDAL